MEYKLPSVDAIVSLVRECRKIIYDPEKAASVHIKGESDFVTDADISVQQFLREKLKETYPDFDFYGEEGERNAINPEVPTWAADPIDGTTNFIHHFMLSCTSLALLYKNRVVIGVVYNPFTDELFSAELGKGAKYNGVPVHVSGVAEFPAAMIGIGTAPYDKKETSELFTLYRKLFEETVDIRRIGSAALDICYVAVGRNDAFIEYRLNVWDFAAGSLIVTEAGGKISDWSGNDVSLSHFCSVAVSNGHLHDELIRHVSEYSPENKIKQ